MFKNRISMLGVALAAMLAGTMTTIPAKAANTTSDDTLISYTVSESYTWTAPADITFTTSANSETKSGTVSVTTNVIGSGKKLVISIDSNEDFLLTDTADSNNTRSYQIKKGTTVLTKGASVLEVAAGTNTGSQALDFVLQSVTVQKAGTYKGTANFVSTISAV